MHIDFIKWMVGYAEGFNLEPSKELQILTPDGNIFTFDEDQPSWQKSAWKNEVYPLLLQRAIEGINKIHTVFDILQSSEGIDIVEKEGNPIIIDVEWYFKDYTIIQAKEQALEYVCEQETK